MITTADGIAYRLVRELEDLIELAGNAMRRANADGSEYEVEDELASARLAVEAYKTFCAETKGDSPAHACELNRAYDGSCLICENAAGIINEMLGSTHTGVDMETSPAPARIAWEKNYSDGSGVEYAVRLDTTKINMVDGGPVVEFEHVGSVEFPINELDWLIACLMRIKAEVRPN